MSSEPPEARGQVMLRIRKVRGVTSPRIQTLAKTGASGGLLTPREIKEVCQAIVAEAARLPSRPCGADR